MSKIGYNIKKLRNVKNLSQQAFADVFNLTRGNISSYEEMRAEPKIETVIKIANYFGIPLEHLLTKQLSVNEILNFNDYFNEEEQQRLQKKFASIPFLNREAIQKIRDGVFDVEKTEQLSFPIYSGNRFLSLELTQDVAVPLDFLLPEHTILFFEQVQVENLHTLKDHFGLYFAEGVFFIGKYAQEGSSIELRLNEWKAEHYTYENNRFFWKLYAKFEKII